MTFIVTAIGVVLYFRLLNGSVSRLRRQVAAASGDERPKLLHRFALRHGAVLSAICAVPFIVMNVVLVMQSERWASIAPFISPVVLVLFVAGAFAMSFAMAARVGKRSSEGSQHV